jgi:hypothetical protein
VLRRPAEGCSRLSARLPRDRVLLHSALDGKLIASRLACLALLRHGTRRSAEGCCSPRGSHALRSRATALSARLKAARLSARLPHASVPRLSALGARLLLASRLACVALLCYGTQRSAEGCSPLGSPASRYCATTLGARLKAAARLSVRRPCAVVLRLCQHLSNVSVSCTHTYLRTRLMDLCSFHDGSVLFSRWTAGIS